MKKFMSLFIIAALMLLGCSGVMAAEADAIMLCKITETEQTVDMSVMLEGEAQDVVLISFCVDFDPAQLSIAGGSIKVGEKISAWTEIIPAYLIPKSETESSVVFMYVAEKAEDCINLAEDETQELMTITFNKAEGAEIDGNSIEFSDLRTDDIYVNSAVGSLVNNEVINIEYSVYPEKFVTQFYSNTPENGADSLTICGYDANVDMIAGEKLQLSAKTSPVNAEGKITWSAEGAAEVDENGEVTAKTKGMAKITATDENGVSDTVEITVAEKAVLPTAIEITNIPENVFMDTFVDPEIKFTPENVTDRRITWSVEDSSAVKLNINTGKFTAAGQGVTTLTATSAAEGVSATAEINAIGVNYADVIPQTVSVICNETVYPVTYKSTPAEYPVVVSLYNEKGEYIVKSQNGFELENFFDIELELDAKGASGISLKDNKILVEKTAAAAEMLTVTVTVKDKSTGEILCKNASNYFSVKAVPTVQGITVNGAAAGGTVTADGDVNIAVNGTGEIYCAYSVDGVNFVRSLNEFAIPADELAEGENNVVIFTYGNNTPGAFGYNADTFIKAYTVKIVK